MDAYVVDHLEFLNDSSMEYYLSQSGSQLGGGLLYPIIQFVVLLQIEMRWQRQAFCLVPSKKNA
jgi:hypothetical protein